MHSDHNHTLNVGHVGQTVGIQQTSNHSQHTFGGYPCSRCNQWVNPNTYHTCSGYPYYPNPYNPYVVPQAQPITIIHHQNPDFLLQGEVAALKGEIAELKQALHGMCELLETMLHRDHNNQDEEVCGYSEDGCESADSEGSTGTSLVKVETPRRRYGWSGA